MTVNSIRQRPQESSFMRPSSNVTVPPDIAQRTGVVASLIAMATPWVFGSAVIFALFAGYRLRDLELTTAEHGVGYLLGIIGATMMLLLMLYPMRKRIRGLAFLGSNRFWFRLHMVLGVLGPVFILYHANFRLGSTNSNVALFCMLVVAGSGLVGRFMYAKIHHGLYGRKASLAELRDTLSHTQDEIKTLFAISPGVRDQLLSFSERALKPPRGLFQGLVRVVTAQLDAVCTRRRVRNIARRDIATLSESAEWNPTETGRLRRHVDATARAFIRDARAVSEFALYERLFSLWHILHLPLFFMLVIAAIVHVIAVHLY